MKNNKCLYSMMRFKPQWKGKTSFCLEVILVFFFFFKFSIVILELHEERKWLSGRKVISDLSFAFIKEFLRVRINTFPFLNWFNVDLSKKKKREKKKMIELGFKQKEREKIARERKRKGERNK